MVRPSDELVDSACRIIEQSYNTSYFLGGKEVTLPPIRTEIRFKRQDKALLANAINQRLQLFASLNHLSVVKLQTGEMEIDGLMKGVVLLTVVRQQPSLRDNAPH